jgi:hypothetical protein
LIYQLFWSPASQKADFSIFTGHSARQPDPRRPSPRLGLTIQVRQKIGVDGRYAASVMWQQEAGGG